MHTDDILGRAFKLVVSLIGAYFLKSLICVSVGESDDYLSHILKAKLSGYKGFEISLSTCTAEFNFMGYEVLESYWNSLLLPVLLFVLIEIAVKTYQHIIHFQTDHERQENLYNHGVLFGWLPSKIPREVVGFGLLAMMALPGLQNIQKELSSVGENTYMQEEELILWIKQNTKEDAVFAGAMDLIPTVKMSALRPIVNHPILDDLNSRARMKVVYSMYSRKPAKEVMRALKTLGINYFILENIWCFQKIGYGCYLPELWDFEDLANVHSSPLCSQIIKESKESNIFLKLFQNEKFQVVQVLEYPSATQSG